MPDEEMLFGSEGRAAIREGRKPETLHRFLEKYVHLQNQCLGEFLHTGIFRTTDTAAEGEFTGNACTIM